MWLELRGDSWRSGPVQLAASFRQRWKGLRPYPVFGLLLAGSAVHGHRLRVPITVAGLTHSGGVIRVETLTPGAGCSVAGARWMLELPEDRAAPHEGMTLETYRWS